MASGAGNSPCGACKFLRRKCEKECIFAPYFCAEEGAAQFAAIHRVFGASNVSKLLRHVPPPERSEAAITIAYEAQARLSDPIYGCVGHIFALQQQVAGLQLQLMQAKAQLAHHSKVNNLQPGSTWQEYGFGNPVPHPFSYEESMSSQSSLDCVDQILERSSMKEMSFQEDLSTQSSTRKAQVDMGELQALAFSMMGK